MFVLLELIVNIKKLMKKIFTLLCIVTLGITANAQNLVASPDMESWDASTPSKPTGWTFVSTTGVTQDTTVSHGGTSSVKFVAPSTGNGSCYIDIPAIAGTTYTLSYWVLDNDVNAKGRHWVQARTAGSATNITWTGTTFQPATYTTDNSSWQYVTATSTTPATTAVLRFDYRVYAGTSSGGVIYVDDFYLGEGTLSAVEIENFKKSVKLSSTLVQNSFDISLNGKANIKLISSTGQLIKTTSIQNSGTIDTSSLSKGVYMVQIETEGNFLVKKIVKQ